MLQATNENIEKLRQQMKENTDSVKKEIFRNNNDMKRENKKGIDGLDGKLSKLI